MDSAKTNLLLTPTKIGDIEVKNRVVMASLSRGRTDPKTGIPNERMLRYYSDRAGAGLLLTEASPISMEGHPWPGAGCIYTKDHAEGWKKITDAVHEKGGKIIVQLWHGGRQTDPTFTGIQSVAPSEIALKKLDPKTGDVISENMPRAVTQKDIKRILEDYKNAAKVAMEAGFDGVEVHGANGYLIDEFIRTGTNQRTDDYGGSVENRCRLCLEVIDICIDIWGAKKVGIKLSPVGRFGDMYDENPIETYTYLVKELDKRGIAYIQFYEADSNASARNIKSEHISGHEQIPEVNKTFRPLFSGTIMANGGFNPETAEKIIEAKNADVVSFGRLFITNPDLIERIQNNWPLNTDYDYSTFWFGEDKGYIDHLTYSQEQEKLKREQENNSK